MKNGNHSAWVDASGPDVANPWDEETLRHLGEGGGTLI